MKNKEFSLSVPHTNARTHKVDFFTTITPIHNFARRIHNTYIYIGGEGETKEFPTIKCIRVEVVGGQAV